MGFASGHGAAGMLSAGIGAAPGNQIRTFPHVSDCVHGILLILEGEVDQPCNLGSAELVSVNQLVDVIEESAGVRLKRRYNLAAATGVRGRTSDNARLRQASGWEPSVALRGHGRDVPVGGRPGERPDADGPSWLARGEDQPRISASGEVTTSRHRPAWPTACSR